MPARTLFRSLSRPALSKLQFECKDRTFQSSRCGLLCLVSLKDCHPERSVFSAKRRTHVAEGPLHPQLRYTAKPFLTVQPASGFPASSSRRKVVTVVILETIPSRLRSLGRIKLLLRDRSSAGNIRDPTTFGTRSTLLRYAADFLGDPNEP